jgi:crotonobetainyl-CoA:carnitine CoA-transferase CaiB-like acyl-CoA transferase
MASGDPGAAHIPDLGADTYSVLTEAGLDSDSLQRLAEAGVLRGAA